MSNGATKNYNILKGKVQIIETNETLLDSNEIERQLIDISRQKTRLIEHNKETVSRYNALLEEEQELLAISKTLGTPIMEEIKVKGDKNV